MSLPSLSIGKAGITSSFFVCVCSIAAELHFQSNPPVRPPSPPLDTSAARPSSTIILVMMGVQVRVLVMALQTQVAVVRKVATCRPVAAVATRRMVRMAVDRMATRTVQTVATQVAAAAVDVAVMAAGRIVAVAHCADENRTV